jgi:7-cyano-7-deazaguanine synthase
MKALVLLSGGIDSSTLLAHTINRVEHVEALTIHYGSKHGTVEANAARRVAAHYRVPHHNVALPDWIFGEGSALMKGKVPHATYKELTDVANPKETPISTIVPFRNGVFLSVATAFAFARAIAEVCFAAHASDYENWAYADCTPDFIKAFGEAVGIGAYKKVAIQAPFIHLTKADIVRLGHSMGVPYELTWSCYDPVFGAVPRGDFGVITRSQAAVMHCGMCPTCIERKEAFDDARVSDPTTYANPARPR